MTYLDMLKAFRNWAVTATGLADAKIRMAHSNDVRPAPVYATVEGLGTVAQGRAEKIFTSGGSVTILGHRTSTVRLAIFGSQGYEYAEKARLGVARDDLIRQALAASIAVQGTSGEIQNVSAPRGTDFEDRFVIDFLVGWVATVTDNTDGGTIENIDSAATTIGGIISDIDV